MNDKNFDISGPNGILEVGNGQIILGGITFLIVWIVYLIYMACKKSEIKIII